MTTIKNTPNGIIGCKFRKFHSIYIDYAWQIVQNYTHRNDFHVSRSHTQRFGMGATKADEKWGR